MSATPADSIVCLLPGLLCDASVWASQRADLGRDFQVYIPDFLGLESLDAMAHRVLDETTGPIWVAGHSMGGRAALDVWRLGGDRVAGLALIDTGIHALRPGEAEPRLELVRRAYSEGMGVIADAWLPPMLHPDRLGDHALVDPLRAMILRATPAQFEGQQHALIRRPDATPFLPHIACPTAVICGRQDAWSPVAQHEAMAAAIPGAVLTVIEDCGHMSNVERPAELTAALRAWIESTLPM